MSLARKCDICGEFYEEYTTKVNLDFPKKLERTNINSLMLINKDVQNKYFSNSIIDCCPKCMKSILKHIEELKGE